MDQPSRPTHVLLIDSQPIALRGLLRALNGQASIDVVGAIRDIDEAVLLAQEFPADVIVYGVSGAAGEAVSAIRRFRSIASDAAVLILGAAESMAGIAIAAGAAGFVARSAPVPLIVASITAVARGDTVVGRSIRGGGVRRVTVRGEAVHRLTVREWEVLYLLDAGLNAVQIAEELMIATNTARNYVQNVLTKLGAHSKLEAVAVARRAGLLRSD
jgi:two-component system, NarL family, nitrate/nitrite response regulator NarL